jgi:hypothetical protein
MKNLLGQFMTPDALAAFVAKQVRPSDVVIDLAAGDGALLSAVSKRSTNAQLIGFDIDKTMVRSAAAKRGISIKCGNGLTARIATSALNGQVTIVGNPPFINGSVDTKGWIRSAFPNLPGKKAIDRVEIQFLARALTMAKATGARVVFVMPVGFADGDTYRHLRTELMYHFKLSRCIEVIGAPFEETEARTVILVIDALTTQRYLTEIAEFDGGSGKVTRIVKQRVEPGVRLDARFHRATRDGKAMASLQLKDIEVSITRGLFSRKDAEMSNVQALHTSDLGNAVEGRIKAQSNLSRKELGKHVVARKGDILLSRTGSRVSWEPVLLDSGFAPITDHVFRIRAHESVRSLVVRSFQHPAFGKWLQGVSKGVCATVLTKRELLEMPLFAL